MPYQNVYDQVRNSRTNTLRRLIQHQPWYTKLAAWFVRSPSTIKATRGTDPIQIPGHTHAWNAFDDIETYGVNLVLCGRWCECGTIQELQGPSRGWVEIAQKRS